MMERFQDAEFSWNCCPQKTVTIPRCVCVLYLLFTQPSLIRSFHSSDPCFSLSCAQRGSDMRGSTVQANTMEQSNTMAQTNTIAQRNTMVHAKTIDGTSKRDRSYSKYDCRASVQAPNMLSSHYSMALGFMAATSRHMIRLTVDEPMNLLKACVILPTSFQFWCKPVL